jgi:hypothetical protein
MDKELINFIIYNFIIIIKGNFSNICQIIFYISNMEKLIPIISEIQVNYLFISTGHYQKIRCQPLSQSSHDRSCRFSINW